MGLSSSQARLLHLTSRMHQIEYKAQRLEAEKLQMANESDRVYEEYLDALDATKIQYSTLTTDGAITYLDATYNNLCMGYISNGTVMYSGAPNYLGDGSGASSSITSLSTAKSYQLVDAETGKVYVPDYVYDIYNDSSDADDFAEKMAEYTAGNYVPAEPETPQGGDSEIYEAVLSRRDSVILSVKAGENSKITLQNDMTNTNYTYTITSNSDTTVNVKFLANGRLKIEGNDVTIKAGNGQKDDIILIGSNNKVYTFDGDDTVRVGRTITDEKFFKLTSSEQAAICSNNSGNYINTGDGDDYITTIGSNEVDGDRGNDALMTLTSNAASVRNTENLFEHQKGNIVINSLDYNAGWSSQGSYGDCRLLAMLNSMDKEAIKNSVTIKEITIDGKPCYNVTFNRSAISPKEVLIEKDVFSSNYALASGKGHAQGDIDMLLIEFAMDKVVYEASGHHDNLEVTTYNNIAKIMYGNDKAQQYNIGSITDVKTSMSGLENFIVGATSGNEELGIIANHAYSVKSISSDGKYIELVNPWDSNDVLRLDNNDFKAYFKVGYTFGTGSSEVIYNTPTASPAVSEGTSGVYLGANSANAQYNYYVDLYDLLTSSGMNAIPAGMENSAVWLANVIQAGAVLKMQDSNNNWIDTSVATNTRLQEVSDTTLIKKAEAKYEADMKKIDRKERKYDADLATFDNERNAIKQEMDTLKTVAKENVERTFKLFS